MDLRNQQIKDTYGNLATINTSAGTPTTGVLQNGAGSNVTSLTIEGTLDATNVDATNLTGTLATAAQTNITSVGTLTGLAVSGDANFDSGTLFVDVSENRVGIGTSSPNGALEIYDTSNPSAPDSSVIIYGRRNGGANVLSIRQAMEDGSSLDSGNGPVVRFQGYDGTGYDDLAGLQAVAEENLTGSQSGGRLIFYTTPTGSTSLSERLRIDSSGNVGIGTSSPSATLHVVGGNIKVGNTYGIDFSDTADGSGTTTSEVLDDYEEGTWTPVYGADSGSASMGTQTGSYTKIGNVVYCNVTVSGAKNTLSGDIKITGLPFSGAISGVLITTRRRWGTQFLIRGQVGGSEITLFKDDSDQANDTRVTDSDMSASATTTYNGISASFFYFV